MLFFIFLRFLVYFFVGGGVSVKAAFVHESYCSVEVASVDDLYSERAKVKVYVVNSFVGRWLGILNENSPQTSTFTFGQELLNK